MSLKSFHVVFISASVLLAFLLAAWCLAAAPQPAGTGRIAGAVLAALAGVGLVAYETWFLRKMRRLP